MKKDAFYFPHDSNAHNDPKIIDLRVRGGFDAVGIFWTVIEILRESSGYKYPYNIAMLSLAVSHPIAMLETPIKLCVDVGLLVVRDGFLMSGALNKRMTRIDRRREILRQAGRRGNESRWRDRNPIATRSQPDRSKVKESKVKESISIPASPEAAAKPLTDVQKIVTAFKMLQGYPKDDKAWDTLNFARFSKPAKQLLDFVGNWREAIDCAQDVYEKFTAKGLTVTLETICKHASEWKKDRQEKVGGGNGVHANAGHGNS